MEIHVLIEPVAGNGYRAVGGDPFAIAVEGATRDEVLQKLEKLVCERMSGGAELIRLEIPSGKHPLLRAAGIWDKDDPLVQEWKQIMAENRRKADQDPDY